MPQTYIYILQDGNDLGTDIYKIGKTTNIIRSITQYSKKSILHEKYPVIEDKLDSLKKLIINKFKTRFLSERGKEWFKGNINEMMFEIENIIKPYKVEEKYDKKYEEENEDG